MALVVFLRGVNVGGHRRFRPSTLARELRRHDVVNIGAAGTFVVREPGPHAQFVTALRRRLPFDAEIALCDGRDIERLLTEHPFAARARPGVVRFVSILSRSPTQEPAMPAHLPSVREWYVRLLATTGPFVFGEYRRHMKTIGYLGRIDSLFGAPVTTRNWNTILSIARILRPDAGT